MKYSLETIARLQLEAEFGTHANEVLNAGWMPPQALQLGLQPVVPDGTPHYRPQISDPDEYLQAVYNCQQQ